MKSQLLNGSAVVVEPEAVSIPETCRITGLGRSTIYQMISDGTLPSIKIGKRRLVRTSTARRLIADREMVGIDSGA
jgi:excisionase family DNA binding protein